MQGLFSKQNASYKELEIKLKPKSYPSSMKATMGSVMRSRLERESMSVRDVNGHKSCKPASLTFSTLDIFELEIFFSK